MRSKVPMTQPELWPPWSPPKVLIVEDEALIAAHERALLEEAGYAVVGVTGDAEEAFMLCQTDPPHVALVDVQLAGDINGISLAVEIAQRHEIAAVLVTGNPQAVIEQAWDFRYAVLSKPFEDSELLRAVAAAFELARIGGGERARPAAPAAEPD